MVRADPLGRSEEAKSSMAVTSPPPSPPGAPWETRQRREHVAAELWSHMSITGSMHWRSGAPPFSRSLRWRLRFRERDRTMATDHRKSPKVTASGLSASS